MCHFELKPSSGKVMSSPPCIELASCIQYICKKFENAHLFSEIFSIFLSGMKIDHAYPHQVYFQNFENQYRFFVFFLRKTCRRTCHITNLEQLWGHFKLKTSCSKKAQAFHCVIADSAYSTYAKNLKTLQLFLIFFQKFLSDERIPLKNAGKNPAGKKFFQK